MNNRIKLRISVLLMALVLMLSAATVFAEASYIPVSGDALISVYSEPSDYDPEEADPGMELPVCDFEIIRHSGELITKDAVIDPIPFRSLLGSDAELRITPPDGYYISSLTLTNESGYRPSDDDLLTCGYAQNTGTAISLFLSEIASDDGTALEDAYVSALGKA